MKHNVKKPSVEREEEEEKKVYDTSAFFDSTKSFSC